MLEFRKDLFADERDDNLNVIGKGDAAPGHARAMSPAARASSTITASTACCI